MEASPVSKRRIFIRFPSSKWIALVKFIGNFSITLYQVVLQKRRIPKYFLERARRDEGVMREQSVVCCRSFET